ITGAFTAAPQEDLTQLAATLKSGLDALKSIETAMVSSQGVQAAPSMGPLTQTLFRMHEIVSSHIRAPVAEDSQPQGTPSTETAAAFVPGQIRSREDAVRSLELVSEFFRRT